MMQANHTFLNNKSLFYIDDINDGKILNFQKKKGGIYEVSMY